MNNGNVFRTSPPIQDGMLLPSSRQLMKSLASPKAVHYLDLFFNYLEEQMEMGHGLVSLQIAATEGYPVYQTAWMISDEGVVRSNLLEAELVKGLAGFPTVELKEVISLLNMIGPPAQWYGYLQALVEGGYQFTSLTYKNLGEVSLFAFRPDHDLVSITFAVQPLQAISG